MKKISILFSLVLLASSCVKQMEEPESAKIAGMWAVVDDNDFTTKYIEFEHGNIKEYVSGSEKHYVADKSVWNCQEGGFKQLSTVRYSLVDGTLHYGSSYQKMRVDGETMTLGEMKCRLVENICPKYYSTVNIFNPTQFFAFNGGNVEWSYNITQPVEGFLLKAKGPDWVSDLRVTADKISFTVPETTTTRTGTITLSYPSAEDIELYVTQLAAEINLDKTSVTLGYAASSSSFTYSIPDPQDGYTLNVEVSHDWITDVKDNGSSISFSVKENNIGSSRTGKITVTYGGISKEFVVTQTYSATSIVFTPTSGNHNYMSGTYNFKYTVSNPREGQKATISTSDSWITGVTDSNGTVSYTIPENNSGSTRTGKITVTYGGISKEFVVTQTYSATSISLNPANGSHDYTSGTYNFKYTITNPREGQEVSVSTSDTWITGVIDTNGTVSYMVSINTTGSSRSGKITVKYGDLSKTFTITQSAASLTLSSSSATCTYASTSKSFSITISNRQSDLAVSIKSDVSWITNLSESNGTVSYKVAENNSGSSRTGKITVTYAGVSKVFTVKQSYTASGISLSPTSGSHDYTSGTYNFKYTITNPREGQKASVSTSDSWITGVTDTNGTVSYTIPKNTSGSTRTGKITVTYAGINKVFSVTQGKGPVNLSVSGTANCYVVSNAGSYYFKSVKGNSSTSVGTVSSVAVLWESFGTSTTPSVGDLVKSVSYTDGNIHFDTATNFKEGNAVIAAKNSSGTILWSWHIWFTDQPQGQVYYNNAGVMMDRNLGATSATPGYVGALGLLYQWGRKDPFLGSSSISDDVVAKSTISWPSPVSTNSSHGTVSYVTANPTTFVNSSSSTSYDWHYSSRDNTLWTTSDKPKSIYDPCPVGWRVPDEDGNGIWSKALGKSSSFESFEHYYNSTNKGMNFSGKFGSASTIWYPASGFRSRNVGSPVGVGYYGYYWSASTNGSGDASYLNTNYNGGVGPGCYYSRAHGYSVRCLQVIDEVAGANAEE